MSAGLRAPDTATVTRKACELQPGDFLVLCDGPTDLASLRLERVAAVGRSPDGVMVSTNRADGSGWCHVIPDDFELFILSCESGDS